MAGARRKTRSPNLTAGRIRDEALRLIELEGVEGFSTRKLGRALGVEAMAIYWYYPSKDALLDAVVEVLVSKLQSPGREPADFIDAMRQLAHAYRALAHDHPKAFPLMATRRFATPAAYQFLEHLFAMAEDYGLDDRDTARWYRAVASYCSGVALNELAAGREAEGLEGAPDERSAFPHVDAVFGWLAPRHAPDVFSFGLEVLLDAIAKAPKKPKRTKKKQAG